VWGVVSRSRATVGKNVLTNGIEGYKISTKVKGFKMNERIKELEEQCWEPKQYGPPWFDAEKFAELIVRECITTMTNLESDIKQKFPWKKEEVVSTSGHIQKLKEHFGVE
jgi:hypothetical protein